MMDELKSQISGDTEFLHDIGNLRDAGYDLFMNKNALADPYAKIDERYTSARNIAGGILGSGTNMYIGTKLFKFEAKNTRQLVSDGNDMRIIIGKLT